MISDRLAGVLRGLHLADSGLADECAALLGADGFTVSLVVEAGVTELVWCTGGAGARFEELQFTLGEGPGPDAVRSGGVVLEPDLAAVRAGRWPALLPDAELLPVRAVFCFPLRLGADTVGVLTVLRCTARPLSEQEADDALVLATALAMLLGGDGRRQDSWIRAEPPTALPRAVVHQATGVVSGQFNLLIQEALLRLRAYAYSQGVPLADVAEDVVARRLRFRDDTTGPSCPTEPGG